MSSLLQKWTNVSYPKKEVDTCNLQQASLPNKIIRTYCNIMFLELTYFSLTFRLMDFYPIDQIMLIFIPHFLSNKDNNKRKIHDSEMTKDHTFILIIILLD